MLNSNFAAGAKHCNAPNRNHQHYAVSRHSHLHSIPWPIIGHQFVLGALVRRLGYFVDGQAFFNRLAIEVRLAIARGDDRAVFEFEGLVIVVSPDPDLPGYWRVEIDDGTGPEPCDARARAAARGLSEAEFDWQLEHVRELAREGVTPSCLIIPDHIFKQRATRFCAQFVDPRYGLIPDHNALCQLMCELANLSILEGSAVPYFAFPTDNEKIPRPRAQLAVPMYGLASGGHGDLHLVLRVGTDFATGERVLEAPTVIVPSMVRDNVRQLEHIRLLWRLGLNRAAA